MQSKNLHKDKHSPWTCSVIKDSKKYFHDHPNFSTRFPTMSNSYNFTSPRSPNGFRVKDYTSLSYIYFCEMVNNEVKEKNKGDGR